MFWLKCSWNMGCWSPGVWATEGSLTFVLIGGISGSRGRLLIKWSAGYLSIQMIGCYYFLYGHNLLCGHSVWDIISLIASSVQHHGSAENSPEAAGVTFEKCSPLQFHFFQLDCLSIESSKTSILCWTHSRTHIMGHVYWWNSGLSPSYGLLNTSPKVFCHLSFVCLGSTCLKGFLWKEVRVLLLFSGGASQIPS